MAEIHAVLGLCLKAHAPALLPHSHDGSVLPHLPLAHRLLH